jgi:hypothetical protein
VLLGEASVTAIRRTPWFNLTVRQILALARPDATPTRIARMTNPADLR